MKYLSYLFILLILFLFSCNQSRHKQDESLTHSTEAREEMKAIADEAAPAAEYQVASESEPYDVSNESYSKAEESDFKSPQSSPLSTFSIDVDRASYANIRRMISDKIPVIQDAVRIEEMINYFDYQYSSPTDGTPFAVNYEYAPCPWNEEHKLLKIGLQGEKKQNRNLPPSNLVFLLDVSGSMDEPNKLPLLKSSLELLINQLTEKDKVSIAVYAGSSGVVLEPTAGNQKLKIKQAIAQLQASGGTAGEEGLKLAYRLAKAGFIKGGNNRIILATDGDFNLGLSSDKEMEALIEEKRKSGIFLTCLGFGNGNFKDSKMELLADKGNGNYAYIDNISEAKKFLEKEFGGTLYTIAKDVKIQVEFNPSLINSYRLIGYENRRLNDEDFEDDMKDAGELGSGHQVTALYEIIPLNSDSKYAKKVSKLKYSKTDLIDSKDLASIKLRYKKPDGEKSIEVSKYIPNREKKLEVSSDDFKFTAAVAMFGLRLSESKMTPTIKKNSIIKLANASHIPSSEESRNEFLELVKMSDI